jgi:pantothenate kinase
MTLPQLVDRARALAVPGQRRLLGITGAPGAGKSTAADAVVAALGGSAVLVGMDGFHLAQRTLEAWGRAQRKGAPDTFDAAGYVALLGRLRAAREDVVHAPEFRREIEEPIGSAVPVARDVPLVVTEGNYLLLEDGDWAGVRPLLDEVWYLDVDPGLRLERLVARHVAFGRVPEAARAWSTGPDQANADLVGATRGRADLVVRLVAEQEPG